MLPLLVRLVCLPQFFLITIIAQTQTLAFMPQFFLITIIAQTQTLALS